MCWASTSACERHRPGTVTHTPSHCDAQLFDGRSAAAQPVRLSIADGRLRVEGECSTFDVTVKSVRWPERQRHGRRLAYLPDGAMLSCDDGPAWDAWTGAHGLQASLLVQGMQSWRWVLAALLCTVAVLLGSYHWGAPWAARKVVALMPPSVEAQIGETVLMELDERWLQPSKLPLLEQHAWRERFATAMRRAPAPPRELNRRGLPRWNLQFRSTPKDGLGANAFALPGGDIIVTDDMIALLADRPDALIGVLGHEWGHVQRHHGMRSLVQASLLAMLSSAVVGDISQVITAAPAVLGQLAYARDFEREADDDGAALLRANGMDPAALAVLFERLQAQRSAKPGPKFELPIALSSHPADAERMARLRGAKATP
jgi:predicted Zn-dependent protease